MADERSSDLVEQLQDIKEDLHIQDMKREPEYNRRFYVGNLFERTFSYLIGWTGAVYRRIKCNNAGNLQVSSTGTSFDNIDVQADTSADAYATAKDFGRIVSSFDVTTWDFGLVISMSLDNSTWSDDLELPPNFDKQITLTTRYVRFKNKTGGSDSRFQFVGYY